MSEMTTKCARTNRKKVCGEKSPHSRDLDESINYSSVNEVKDGFFGFKSKFSVILAVIHDASVGLAYIVSSRKHCTKQLGSRRDSISLF